MRLYIGLIHKDAGSDYGVSFPDFPGVVSAGATLDEARAEAQEALAFHIEGLIEDGEPIPEPSSLDAVMGDPEQRDGVAFLVSAKIGTRRHSRVSVTLPQELLTQIDRYARQHGLTRSGFLTKAAKEALDH